MRKENQCVDCETKIDYRSKRCRKCFNKGDKNAAWKGGKPLCSDCGVVRIKRRSTYCLGCSSKGERNGMWAGGFDKEAYQRRWYIENRERVAQYNIVHRERHAECSAIRRARKLNQFVEEVAREQVWDRDKGICGICHEDADHNDWHLDHIKPLSRGGEHSYQNVQVSHPRCNRVKHNSYQKE